MSERLEGLDKKFECSTAQLIMEIDYVVYLLARIADTVVLEQDDIDDIKSALLAHDYEWATMTIIIFEKDDTRREALECKGYVVAELPGVSNDLFTLKVEPKDALVLLTLGALLNRTFNKKGLFHSSSFGYNREQNLKHFFTKLSGWEKGQGIFIMDLSASLTCISRSRLLEKLEPAVDDQYILRLISSFLEVQITDNSGTADWAFPEGVPPVNFVAPVLKNYYLDSLDRAFEEKFPIYLMCAMTHTQSTR